MDKDKDVPSSQGSGGIPDRVGDCGEREIFEDSLAVKGVEVGWVVVEV